MEKLIPLFLAAWLLMAIPTVVIAWRGISKAKKTFEGVDKHPVLFREKGASGHSKRSFITRFGGANRVLDVIVTDAEFCIKGVNALFTFIGSYYDLSHRVRRSNILSARQTDKHVEISFVTDAGRQTDVVLTLKNSEQFLSVLNG